MTDLTVSYDARQSAAHGSIDADDSPFVLRRFAASFPAGHVHWILGPNGAGKSTLFRAVAGELVPTSGAIAFDGQSLERLNPSQRVALGIGRFLQSEWVFPNLTILENLLIAGRNAGNEHPLGCLLPSARRFEKQVEAQALERLVEFGFAKQFDVRRTKAGALSCGWAKLLSLVRLVMQAPRLWLLDEPIANVDERNQDRICSLIREQARINGHTIVLIEHEVGRQGRVSEIADRALLLFQGKVVNDGDPRQVKASQVYRDVFGAA